MTDALALLSRRRSVGPAFLTGPGPDASELETLLKLASRVPDHGKLAPWRFIVFQGEGAERAGRLALDVKLEDNPSLDEAGPAGRTLALLALAAGDRRRLARGAARENSGMGAGAVGRRIGDGAWKSRRRRSASPRPGSRNGAPTTRASASGSGSARTSGSPASCISGAPKSPPEDRPRPALAEIVTYF